MLKTVSDPESGIRSIVPLEESEIRNFKESLNSPDTGIIHPIQNDDHYFLLLKFKDNKTSFSGDELSDGEGDEPSLVLLNPAYQEESTEKQIIPAPVFTVGIISNQGIPLNKLLLLLNVTFLSVGKL